MSRRPPRAPEAPPAGVYELRYRLERSYRLLGWPMLASGLIGFVVALLTFHPWVFLLSGPAMGAGWWLLRHDVREELVLAPRTRRLQLVRSYGRQTKVRRELDLRGFVRLETAQYDNRPKGLRCMILLFRADGSAEKLDDRLHEPLLVDTCRQLAQAAALDFRDVGRVDINPPRARLIADEEDEVGVSL